MAFGQATDAVTVRIRASIDGRSTLILDDDTAQWHHSDSAAPGRLGCDSGSNQEPTYLDGIAWYPVWPDVPTCENRDCDCDSDVFTGMTTAIPNQELIASLDLIEGRGSCTLVAQPRPDNGYRVVIEFLDPESGADWYEVDLRLECGVVRTCTSTTNSSGLAARIDMLGSMSLKDNDAWLEVTGCPQSVPGLFVFGAQATQLPFGDGYLCISPFAPGLQRLSPALLTTATGTAARILPLDTMSDLGQINAGSSCYFQLWFRDPLAGGAGFNLSDAVRVILCP